MRSQLKLILGLVTLLAIQAIAQIDFETLDLASMAPKKASDTRSTELGVAIPSKDKTNGELEVIMKDPALSEAWGIKMTDSQNAWRLTRGSREIRVAIIDTGIDAQHPDLTSNLWVNEGETGLDSKGRNKATNGIDDDGNGFIDDVHGWNFVGNNNDLKDSHGHGTHIAGIIGAEGGNGIGISGVSPHVSLMVLKYYDPNSRSSDNLTNTVKAIDYAVKMNAHIINYSGGGLSPAIEERQAIERAMKKGILFVAAAGNERSNSDVRKYYPADYGLANIVSVTAIDKTQNVLPSSNWGESTVHIAAPGNNIYSTLPNGQYGYMTGTSQATAFVSGVAALIMANNSEMHEATRMIKYLTQTGDTDMKLTGKTMYRKRLNTYKALALQDSDLNVAGARVENTAHLTFSLNENSKADSSPSAISNFGRNLQKMIKKN